MTKRALIKAYLIKNGIVEFARKLTVLVGNYLNWRVQKVTLDQAGIPTIAIDDVTGFPEMMDGRNQDSSSENSRWFVGTSGFGQPFASCQRP